MSITLWPPPSPYSGAVNKAPFDDIDPEYGLHGYTLHMVLHNTVAEIMSGQFSQLFCRKGESLLHFGRFIQMSILDNQCLLKHTLDI